MKKILSAILAILMIGTIAIPAFAAEETPQTKTVDNTFDNYTPAPGQKAPENWYDPYCYESDGRINKYCLSTSGTPAVYCPEYQKIFTTADMGRTRDLTAKRGFRRYYPYNILCKDFYCEGVVFDHTQWYCPYCGKYQIASYVNDEQVKKESACYTHKEIKQVCYGEQCETCGLISMYWFLADEYNINAFSFVDHCDNPFQQCSHSDGIRPNEDKMYRFLTTEQRESEYAFIFKETEMDFGDGKDCRYEDLKRGANDVGAAHWLNETDNPMYEQFENQEEEQEQEPEVKLTFWQKIVRFFTNIGLWFANLFK